MKIDESAAQRVISHLKEVAPEGFKCPICGNNHWNIDSSVLEISEFYPTPIPEGGQKTIMPMIPLICSTCGNTLLLNAVRLGIVERSHDNNERRE